MKQYLTLLFAILLSQSALSQLDPYYSKFRIVKSKSIEYYPVWGETDNILYVKFLPQEWRKYDLTQSEIVAGNYNLYEIGINNAKNYTIVTNDKLITKLNANRVWKSNEINDLSNNNLSFQHHYDSSTIYLNDKKIMEIWGTTFSLALSPSGRYVACVVKNSVLMIFDLKQELGNLKLLDYKYSKMSNIEKADYLIHNTPMQGLENCLNNFTTEEKKTIEYNYYFGVLNYFKSFEDTSLIKIAIENLNKACNDSRYYQSYILLSLLYESIEDWDNTLKFADKSIEFYPKDPAGYLTKALYYEHIKETDNACDFFQKAADLGDEWAKEKLKKCN